MLTSIHFLKKLSIIVALSAAVTMHSASAMENKKQELVQLINQATNNALYSTNLEAYILIDKINQIQSYIAKNFATEAGEDINENMKPLYNQLQELVNLLNEIAFPSLYITFFNDNEPRKVKITNLLKLLKKFKNELQEQPHNNNNQEINNNNQPQESNETLLMLQEIIACKDTTLEFVKDLLKTIDSTHEDITLIKNFVEENMSIENIRQILDIQAIDFQVIQNNNNKRKNDDNNDSNQEKNNNNNNNQQSDQNKKIKIEKNVEKECSICLEPLENNTPKAILSCIHTFHKQCIDDCLKHKKECPICRNVTNDYNQY